MTDRVIVAVPGVGTLVLSREVFAAALAEGAELLASPAASPAVVEPLLDADTAGGQLSVSARWLEDSARAGIIPHHKLGKFLRFRVSDVADHCRVEGAAIPGTAKATGSESVGRFPKLVRQ